MQNSYEAPIMDKFPCLGFSFDVEQFGEQQSDKVLKPKVFQQYLLQNNYQLLKTLSLWPGHHTKVGQAGQKEISFLFKLQESGTEITFQ